MFGPGQVLSARRARDPIGVPPSSQQGFDGTGLPSGFAICSRLLGVVRWSFTAGGSARITSTSPINGTHRSPAHRLVGEVVKLAAQFGRWERDCVRRAGQAHT